MQAVKLKVNITPDHRLDGIVPDDVPSGEAEVVVLYENPENGDGEQMTDMFSFLEHVQKQDHPRRSLDEIKSYINNERDSWEDSNDLP